ncbi:MAG TPA: anti-sigma regulatory factor [Atribacteraceae bacterium]|nr:anti-sigma regulatory factor [Atribacteraceae bacterium]
MIIEPKPLFEASREIVGADFQSAGDISGELKKLLLQAGFPPPFIRRIVIAAYEAEMNVVIHAYKGSFRTVITPEKVHIVIDDEGPGIPDLDLAFQEGYSTAPPHIREMGFGAGYGLANMRKCSDRIEIDSRVGEGTRVMMDFFLNSVKNGGGV